VHRVIHHGVEPRRFPPSGGTGTATCQTPVTAGRGRRAGEPVDEAAPARRLRAWRLAAGMPSLSTPDAGLTGALRASSRNLGELQIHEPDDP
jgi:hypothetical protein